MAKVSIVMPLYNQQKFLDKCLISVVSQTLKDIEIIVVNDGSTDKSLSIAKKYAKNDKRIKIIDKKNGGYGQSMNMGMDIATGEYIGIVETDDYVKSDMFEKLYTVAERTDADIVKSDYITFKTKKNKEIYTYINTVKNEKYYETLFNPKDNPDVFTYEMNTWTGIYKTSFIRRNNIRHNETPGAAYQDNGFWFQTISLAEKLYYVKEAFYYYRFDNPNSSINSKSKVFCMCDEYKFIYDFIKAHPGEIDEEFKLQYYNKKFFNYMYTYQRVGEEFKFPFIKRMGEEFAEAIENKDIKLGKLDPWVMNMIVRISKDPQVFYWEDNLYNLTLERDRLKAEFDNTINSKVFAMGEKFLRPLRRIKLSLKGEN